MKLSLSVLKRFIDLPVSDPHELRKILDDLGLEVKGLEERAGDFEFNIETLANRGDHLGAIGVARELSARFQQPLKMPQLGEDFSSLPEAVKLEVKTDLCSRIALLQAELPAQLKLPSELAASLGDALHPEMPLVDFCAYLSLEFGQPVHAFDLDKIKGTFRVERLSEPATVVALDSKEYKVPAGAIVGRDDEKICVVSGIIGSANSMVTADTKRILVEAALFDPVCIRKTARAMGLSTDASYAFERGADSEIQIVALRRLVALAGLKPQALSFHKSSETEKRVIGFSFENLKKQLNLHDLSLDEVVSRFKLLGYQVSDSKDSLIVPSWRLWDVEKEEDLIEDFARSKSLSSVKLELPALAYELPELSKQEKVLEEMRAILHGTGFSEVITKNLYSAEDARILSELDPESDEKHVSIKNAIEKSCSNLKITNILHLGTLFANNLKRGRKSFKVYENSRLFRKQLPASGYPYEYEMDLLSLAFGGRVKVTDFRKSETIEEAFYWFKGVLEGLFNKLNLSFEIAASHEAFLHPGRQARLLAGQNQLAFFGQAHPQIQEKLGLPQGFLYAELDLFRISEAVSFESDRRWFSDFPAIERDLTLTVRADSQASEVIRESWALNPENLRSLTIVDDFKKAEEEFRRVSYRFIFQNETRTLSAEEVETEMQKIISSLGARSYHIAA